MLNAISAAIIGAAYEVHNVLGFGFAEKVYERALAVELELRGVRFKTQQPTGVSYKGENDGAFIADLLVEDAVIVELKSANDLHVEHERQCLNYLRAGDWKLGLVLNFGPKRVDVKRQINCDPRELDGELRSVKAAE